MKTKLLILQNELSAYNVSVYNLIAEHYDLTLGFYDKDKSKENCRFNKIKFKSKKIGPFIFINGLYDYVKRFEIVCIAPDMHVVSYCILPFLHRKFKVTTWGIGFRCSYQHPYIPTRKHVFADKISQLILSHSDALIFYMEQSKLFWEGTSLDMNKIFIAPNTAEVVPISTITEEKKDFLFVGTLYKGKGLDVLLSTYKEYVRNTSNPYYMKIVGDGNERESLESFVKENKLSQLVTFTGAIYDEKKLAEHFKNAILCFSPNQAGLSVPKSMGYGVPFVTRKDAITGGEIYHITNGVNGIMYEKDDDILEIMFDVSLHPEKYKKMGVRAKNYYDNNATISHMAQGAMEAFEYALSR